MVIAPQANQFTFANVIANTDDSHETEESRSRWLDFRKAFIGGSEAAACLGVSRYQTRTSLYYAKTLDSAPIKQDTEKMWAGRMLEPVIAQMFAERTGKHVIQQPYMYVHPEFPWMGGNIDFGILGENAGLECKNTSSKAVAQSEEYHLQCQHYMAVTNASRWYLAYLLYGWKFDYVVIERDEELIQMLIQGETDFWNNHVVPRIPPVEVTA